MGGLHSRFDKAVKSQRNEDVQANLTMALGHNRLDAFPIFVEWHTKIVVNVRTIKRLYVCGRHRQLLTVGRASNLYFDFSIDYKQALACRKANGDYLRKGQWNDLYVEVYIV